MKRHDLVCLLVLLVTALAHSQVPEAEFEAWVQRPFEAPHAEAFGWQEADSAGVALWHELRAGWGTFENPVEPVTAAVKPETAWGWWWRLGHGPWFICIGLLLLVLAGWGQAKSRLRTRHWVRARMGIWPELEHISNGLRSDAASSGLTAALFQAQSRLHPGMRSPRTGWKILNNSERECAEYILQGLGPNAIAELMHCTPKHVYNVRSSIRKKLGIDGQADLVAALTEKAQG